MSVYFVCGHGDITDAEFAEHYVPKLDAALADPQLSGFVVGDFRGVDTRTQEYLSDKGIADKVSVFHMYGEPRNLACKDFQKVSGFGNDEARDSAMTAASTHDIAWVRHVAVPAEDIEAYLRLPLNKASKWRKVRVSGTEKNLLRRRRGLP